jgi:anthranilate phosphoribosyltransferase
LTRVSLSELKGGDAAHNARALKDLLAGAKGPYRDIVLLNAAAALVVAGRAPSLVEGVALAESAIDTGEAARALDRLVAISQGAA